MYKYTVFALEIHFRAHCLAQPNQSEEVTKWLGSHGWF